MDQRNPKGYDEKTLWNQKYAQASHTSLQPDPFLLSAYSEFLDDTKPGSALDVAGGVGRHALWLAELRPAGFLIYKTYTTESKRLGRGPSHPMYLLQPNELLRAFQSLRILHYHETTTEKGIAELVAQK